jgi:hypothetical protein
MKKNVGNLDAIMRVLVALVFAYLFKNEIVSYGTGVGLMIMSVYFLLTAMARFCPMYYFRGVNTIDMENKQ